MLADTSQATKPAETDQAIRIEEINDTDLIASTLRHPRIYPHISDDGCPDAHALDVVPMPGAFFLGAYDGAEYLGCFLIQRHNFVMYEGHTCLLPNAWGRRAVLAASACIAWLFENTECRRLITTVPEGNRLAYRLATSAGMVEFGVNPNSMQRGGKLVNTRLLGVSKG